MAATITSVADLKGRLDGERTAFVTTVDERGTLSARPLTIQRIDSQGDIWFLVDRDADWVGPAQASAINASVVDEGATWVSFAGRAEVITDRRVIDDLCDTVTANWFGDDGAEPVALRVASDRIEWWTAPGTLAQGLELARAAINDHTPDMGESGTLDV